jgi:hypothetical protein
MRSALKGRQIESSCNAEVESNCRISQLPGLILRNDRCEIHPISCRPFRANYSFWAFPGLKPWAESFSPFGAGPLGPMLMTLNKYSGDGASLHLYPGTSCLATIGLSLRDKNHSPVEAPLGGMLASLNFFLRLDANICLQ